MANNRTGFNEFGLVAFCFLGIIDNVENFIGC